MLKIKKANSKTKLQKLGKKSSVVLSKMEPSADTHMLDEEANDSTNKSIFKTGTKKKHKVRKDIHIPTEEMNVFNGPQVAKASSKKKLKKQKVREEEQTEVDQCTTPPPTDNDILADEMNVYNGPLVAKASSKKKLKKQKIPEEEQTKVDQCTTPPPIEDDIFADEMNVYNGPLVAKASSKKKLKKQKVREEEQTEVDQCTTPPHIEDDILADEMNVYNGPLVAKASSKKKLKKQKIREEEQTKVDQCTTPPHIEDDILADEMNVYNGPLVAKASSKKKLKKQKVREEQTEVDQCKIPPVTNISDIPNDEANVCNDELIPEAVANKQKFRPEKEEKTIDEPSFNIEQCKNPLESNQHWALRRAFLKKNLHILEPDTLISLAQAYINVELLGCTYPPETMQMIEKCSEGLGRSYYREKALMLKRTLVSAAGAAACKVQKLSVDTLDEVKQAVVPMVNGAPRYFDTIPMDLMNCLRNDLIIINNNMRLTMETFNKLDNGVRIATRTLTKRNGKFHTFVKIQNFTLGQHYHRSNKIALKTAMKNAMEFLSQHCYSITRKKQAHKLSGVEVVEKFKVEESDTPETSDTTGRLDTDNLGFRLLAKLGWSGGGLGASGDGIMDPVMVDLKLGRQGLGMDKKNNSGVKMDQNKIKQMLTDFLQGKMENQYIVFSSEYSLEERQFIHKYAHQMGLKSQSYGNANRGGRHLVVSRRVDMRPVDLLKKILVEKDPTFCEMYKVTPPTGPL